MNEKYPSVGMQVINGSESQKAMDSGDAEVLERLLRGVLLFPVASTELVSRYNECLERLGISATSLTSFHIDRMGWSPEIARERADPYYLSAGIANPMAVLLSPDQQVLPVLFPYNSYDARMIDAYFERFKYEIADITRTTCVGIDIDPDHLEPIMQRRQVERPCA